MTYPQNFPENAVAPPLVAATAVLFKRRGLFLGILGLTLFSAAALAVGNTRTYSYTTVVNIGQLIRDGQRRLLDNPDSLIAKIQSVYAPAAEVNLEKDTTGAGLRLSMDNPRSSEIVVLSTSGPLGHESIHQKFHQSIIDQVIVDHRAVRDVQSLIRADGAPGSTSGTEKTDRSPADTQVEILDTRVLCAAIRSRLPVDVGPSFILGLGLVLGVILSVIGCLAIEVLAQGSARSRKMPD